MELNNHASFTKLDPHNMLGEIDTLPEQLQNAWELSLSQPLPKAKDVQQIIITGMGGSAIGADLLNAYIAPHTTIPVFVQRNYDLPAWAKDDRTLVIASSHSGNTEETLSSFDQAVKNGCRTLTITTGGNLAQIASETNTPVWIFEHSGQPRAAVGYSFGLLLGLVARLGFIPNPAEDIAAAIDAMRVQQVSIDASAPVVSNPAKRLAGQIYGRFVTVFGADILEPVARRWKGQISEVGKAVAAFEALPEADHNTLAGVVNPETVLEKVAMIFLTAPSLHPRNRLRTDLTRRVFMLEGLNTDFVEAVGSSRLAQQWTALHFGDYVAYYLAMAYNVDPTPVEAIESLKLEMKRA